jgi:hypothetical protein
MARFLGINLKTVARKLEFLAQQARVSQAQFLDSLKAQPVQKAQLDELETFEISKCLPLSVPLMVRTEDRKILGFRVARMPAKGLLAAGSRKKYGPRVDERAQAMAELLAEVQPLLSPSLELTTDQNPKYPGWVRAVLPHCTHRTVKGRRGCVVGQGELKKIGWDPLFSLNHTCAMLRANINRLFRKTWCTTKRPDRLADHIALYVQYHNKTLTSS